MYFETLQLKENEVKKDSEKVRIYYFSFFPCGPYCSKAPPTGSRGAACFLPPQCGTPAAPHGLISEGFHRHLPILFYSWAKWIKWISHHPHPPYRGQEKLLTEAPPTRGWSCRLTRKHQAATLYHVKTKTVYMNLTHKSVFGVSGQLI